MPEQRWNDMEPEERLEELSDYLDQMEEEDFDPAVVDRCLAAMEDLEPEASEFDAEEALRTFREKHRDLIRGDREPGQEQPGLKVLPGARRPRRRRLAARIAAVAAVTAASCLLICQAAGIDVLGFFAKWGREEFWFPGTGAAQVSSAAVEGDYATLQDALDANGITAPMAPNWTPGEAEGFGPLTESAQVSQEMQSTLITAQWRDSAGKGYDVEIVRYDLESASTSLAAAGERNTEQYVCDGTSYYIMDTGDGTARVLWNREDLTGDLAGDLTVEMAEELVRSITRPEGEIVYTAPSPDYVPLGNSLQSMLTAYRLDARLAPTWRPAGFEKCDISGGTSGLDSRVTTVHAVYDNSQAQKTLAIHLEWWDDESAVEAPVFAGVTGAPVYYLHNGVEFRIYACDGGYAVAWQDGHVSGYITGGITLEEAKRMVDSIPRWSQERPEAENIGQVIEPDYQYYDSLAEALEDYHLDAGLVPSWVPEGFVLEEAEAMDMLSSVEFDGVYVRGEEYLMVHLSLLENGDDGRTTVYMKDDQPVTEYLHNGVTYYIMTNGDWRTVAWKSGNIEGSISGSFTLEEAKQMVDSITAGAES
ncbi:DUF4367 domain-containing protein [uncultured Pseudoflavonifractor sp.]|uniref:DUF4367 domain-containing protein n=1 Tax=uncultured Pseudoflavonifractor sp. TaxID=1221379 RepID=UPI0025D197FA|nr:DUF4367 domain-containing protein [uncultured Pseudoflavonifractor sp.]